MFIDTVYKCVNVRREYQEIKTLCGLPGNILQSNHIKRMYAFSHASMAQNVPGFKAVHKSYREIKFIHTSMITSYLDEK